MCLRFFKKPEPRELPRNDEPLPPLLAAAAKIPGPDRTRPITLAQLREDMERLRTFRLPTPDAAKED